MDMSDFEFGSSVGHVVALKYPVEGATWKESTGVIVEKDDEGRVTAYCLRFYDGEEDWFIESDLMFV